MEQDTRNKVKREKSEWLALFSRQESSGLSQKDFCEREGISLSTYNKWRMRLIDSGEPGAGFVELKPEASSWDIELDLGAGVVLRLRR